MCPGLPWVFFALELIDAFDRGEAAHPQLMRHDGLYADGGSQMRLPRAWATDEHDVVGVLDERAAVLGFNERLIHRTIGEREA